MNAAELLRELVAIPSISGDELRIAMWVEAFFAERGMRVRRDDRNVEVIVRGRAEGPRLLFSSHLDVVPPGEGWATDPFVPEVDEGRLVGRGSNDAKASVAAMMLAAVALEADPPERGELVLALTCEEERGRNGLEKFLPSLGRLDAAVVGEPTGLHPAVAQNGLLIMELTARGKAGHAARPWLAINAIDIAAKDVGVLHSLVFEPKNEHVGAMTLVVTQFNAGTAHNVIPGDAKMVVDARTIPEIPADDVIQRVREVVGSEVHVRSDRLGPVKTEISERIVQCALAANPDGKPFGSPTLSDWAHLKGIPAVKMGPGLSEISHTTNEWVESSQVGRAATIYERIARGFLS